MAHKVLYRKYRPDNFDAIIGQDYIVEILKNSIKNNKIAHAYIFSGPRGTGKTTTAKVFAKSINCQNLQESGPCGKCEACLNFEKNTDIVELDAASNNGVDEIRQIIDNARISPSYSKYKVYIIDEVHMLTTNAFNALLLTLEEPPSNIIFILATTNIENVPITILSRCQRYDFKKISVNDIANKLKEVCKLEKVKIKEDALQEIAVLSDGGMRDALSILEQISQENKEITLEDIEKIYGIVPKKYISNLLESYENDNSKEIIECIKKLESLGLNYKSLVKTTIEALRKRAQELINLNNVNNFNKIKKLMFELNETLTNLNIYIDPISLYELCFLSNISSCESGQVEHFQASIEEKASVDNKETSKNYFPGNNFDLESFKRTRINNAFCNPKKEILSDLKELWTKKINSINNNKIKNYLTNSQPVCASSEYIILVVEDEAESELINLKYVELENEISSAFEHAYKIVAIVSNEWQILKKEYVQNIKAGIKYSIRSDFAIKEEANDKHNITIADDVFNNVIVEEE